MPPVPPAIEAGIPGSTVAFSASSQLYTHSSKFPIERQITLSSTEKNFKIPILNDLKKRSKGAVIAPDAPPKRLAAWIQQEQMQPHQIYSEQQQQQATDSVLYRASYCPEVELYSTAKENDGSETKQEVAESNEKMTPKSSRGVTKTYHALKDIISGKFRGKDGDKVENANLNNTPDNTRRPTDGFTMDHQQQQQQQQQQQHQDPAMTRLPSSSAYPPDAHLQFAQHAIQQHLTQQQQQQQYYAQQLRTQQQQQYSHLLQPRSQELLQQQPRPAAAAAHQDQIYAAKAYAPSPAQLRHADPHHHHPQMQQQPNDFPSNHQLALERRSAQQIERDNLKQKLEARRTLSQPHLLQESETSDLHSGAAPPGPISVRRGSLGNILEANGASQNHRHHQELEKEKESDDGGFLNRNAKAKYLDQQQTPQKTAEGDHKDQKRRPENNDNVGRADGERERAPSNVDSGRGSAAYSSGRRPPLDDVNDVTTNEAENDSEWVDIVEKELRHILEPKLLELSLRNPARGVTRSTVSGGSISSITPPLPPLSGGDNTSPPLSPKTAAKFKGCSRNAFGPYDPYKGKAHARDPLYDDSPRGTKYGGKKIDYNTALRGKQIFGLDSTDLTSTTTRSLDLESILDGQSDSDANLSVADTKAIRKQLEGLENMYSEVLRFLGVNKRAGGRYQPSDPRIHKKRHGSMSSLPSSSVSSVKRERRYVRGMLPEERRRGAGGAGVREPKATARRFQRLEAHVVTLARSVAHLSSEMRTQHLVVQEIESIRQEVAALRAQTNMLNIRSQSARPVTNLELPTLASPTRVKKLTKFFGDEPPLLRLFLRKLGYEKYANLFENEKIGMVELPYMSEERLQKMGVPLGPRLRIMQEAQISVYKDNTLCIV